MKVTEITIETIRVGSELRENAIILWTEDGTPHTLPELDCKFSFPTQLATDEKFEILGKDDKTQQRATCSRGAEIGETFGIVP